MIKFKLNTEAVIQSLVEFEKQMRSGAFRPVLTRFGYDVLAWLRREYLGLSRRVWPKISKVTYVLSGSSGAKGPVGPGVPRRRVKPVGTPAELEAACRNARPLIDTGRTFSTLIPGQTGNVFRVTNKDVTVGSKSPILGEHQKSYPILFQFGVAEYDALKRNVRQKIGGKPNPFFRKWYLILKRMHGKTYNVPARPLPTDLPPQLTNKLHRELAKRIVEIWRETNLRAGRRKRSR